MAPQTRRSAAQGNSQAVEPTKEWMHHKRHSVNKTVRNKQGGQQLAGGRTVPTANQRDVFLEIEQKWAGIQARCTQKLRHNNFMKLNPPTFLGGANHSEAVAWLIKMEQLFNVFGCSDEEKVNYATYRLSGTAITWWRLEKSKCKQGTEPCTWDNFEKAFCAQYIPDSVRLQMAEDLINLKQKNLTVVQYEAQFSKLARFVPPWVDGDEVLARRFEGGLRPQIKALVIPFELKAYRDIARKASLVEKCLLEVERDGNDVQKKRHAFEVPRQEQDSYNPEGRDSKCLRLQMERDLINLKQNNLTVSKYEAEFHRLASFSPSLVADEAIRALRFEEGLKPQIKLIVVPFELKTFTAVVNKAKLAERVLEEEVGHRQI